MNEEHARYDERQGGPTAVAGFVSDTAGSVRSRYATTISIEPPGVAINEIGVA